MALEEAQPVPERKKLNRRGELQLARVRSAFFQHIKDKQAVPTVQDVCDAVGISKRQVSRYLNEFDWKDAYGDLFRSFTPEVMVSLLAKAKKGDTPAIKLWFEIVEGWRPSGGEDFAAGGTTLIKPTIYIEAIATPDTNVPGQLGQ